MCLLNVHLYQEVLLKSNIWVRALKESVEEMLTSLCEVLCYSLLKSMIVGK